MSPTATVPVDLSIFIPCLNEEERICTTLETVRESLLEIDCVYEVQVVDDGSTDSTAEVVLDYAARHPEMQIHLHSNPTNLGLAHSYVDTAFRARGEYFFLVWGDNAFTKKTIVDVLSQLGQYDLVVPYLSSVEGKPWSRRCCSRVYTLLVNTLSGHRIRYYNGGVLCRRYDVLRWAPRCVGFSGFLADMISQLLDLGATCIEVPFESRHTVKAAQNSVLTVKNFASTGHTLLNILLRRIRNVTMGPLPHGVFGGTASTRATGSRAASLPVEQAGDRDASMAKAA